MIIISEYRIPQEQIKEYKSRGIDFAYGYQNPRIHKGEAVGILLKELYPNTMDLINNLLFRHHNVTLKYNGVTYMLSNLEEWKHTHQSDTDQLKQVTDKHYILQVYEAKRKEYYESKRKDSIKKRCIDTISGIKEDINYIKSIVHTFARFYDIYVPYDENLDEYMSTIELYNAYKQIKYYINNNISYVNDVPCISIEDEPMFSKNMFKVDTDNPDVNVTTFGDVEYMEDFVYKNTESSCI